MAIAIYMEETGEADNLSSVVFWDGKKYRYQPWDRAWVWRFL